jgi:membrane-bound lytic murein transglycosylase MltF
MAKKQKSNVDAFLEREINHVRCALENSSRHFDEKDALTVNTLEAVYGAESSFGVNMNKRGIDGAAGHFQFKKVTAQRFNLKVTANNDQRFDIDDSSWAAAKYLKELDKMFSKRTVLTVRLKTRTVGSKTERKIFVLAAYNAGEGNIAKAQNAAYTDGKRSDLWNNVKKYLKDIVSTTKMKEISDYLPKIAAYEAEFSEKSSADKSAKHKKPFALEDVHGDCRWKTIDGRPVCLEN